MDRSCVDCGASYQHDGKGRPPIRCVPCRTTHQRVRPALPDTKERSCVECGTGFIVERTAGVKTLRGSERCESCRTARPQTKSNTCTDCGEDFTVERAKGGKYLRGATRCKPCRAAVSRQKQYRWREANPEAWKAVQNRNSAKRLADPEYLRDKREREACRRYGLKPEQLKFLQEAHGGLCAICRRPPHGRPNGRARDVIEPSLHVDHCHTTGRVRGLLCGNCNTMIGLAGEDSKVLMAAVEYLEKG